MLDDGYRSVDCLGKRSEYSTEHLPLVGIR